MKFNDAAISRLQLGLLLNFNVAELRHGIERVIDTHDEFSCSPAKQG